MPDIAKDDIRIIPRSILDSLTDEEASIVLAAAHQVLTLETEKVANDFDLDLRETKELAARFGMLIKRQSG